MVVGWKILRSQVDTALGSGLAALPRQRMRSPAGTKAALDPYLRESAKSALVRSQSGPCSAFAQASSTGPGRRTVWSGVRSDDPEATVRSARERSGARPFRRL